MKTFFSAWFRKVKSRIDRRLDKKRQRASAGPVIAASNIHYDVSNKTQAISHGGIGAIHAIVCRYRLIENINQHLHLLKVHLPYTESDHVLNIAYNTLCDGTRLEDLELRRNDENFLNALGTCRLPDPTTAGDFCRRFSVADIDALQDAIHASRCRVWAEQSPSFFNRAVIDMDGSLVETTGECKRGMDIAYDGTWGYHVLLLSLANTGEVLSIVNRPGNRPSHEGAAREVDRAVSRCLEAGFRQVLLRGDTDFSQTEHLDKWDDLGRVRFIFGYDAKANLVGIAEDLPSTAWRQLTRPPRYEVRTEARQKPENVKDRIVRERGFETLRLRGEEVAEFEYRPSACQKSYRMIVVRKNITKARGEVALFDEIRHFFYITNDFDMSAEEVVFSANERCNQENLFAQLKAMRALHAPLGALESNWAYMVMTALAWTLKAWFALALPEEPGRWQTAHREQKEWVLRLEFRTFLNIFMKLPCQIVRTSRKLVYRLLGWNPRLNILFRLITKLGC